MKKTISLIITTFLLLTTFSQVSSQSPTPAFPNAEGFGANTKGGRGGVVMEVTNTNDSGAGSLRACIIATGARTCVFRIGGLITLATPLTISNPYITIAGQTAPGGGITIKLGAATNAIITETHDVIIRYLSIRTGAGGDNHPVLIAKNGIEIYNVMIDHLSLSWGLDENISTWYRVNNITIQWSLISEALDCSTHSKGCHSKGLMIGGYKGSESGGKGAENVSILNNLMAHNLDRNPLVQICGIGQVINNVTYNAGTTYSHQKLNCTTGVSYVNWVNNYHKKGSAGTFTDFKIAVADDGTCGLGKTYQSGNVGMTGTWTTAQSGSCAGRTDIFVKVPAVAPVVETTTGLAAYNSVLFSVGNSSGISCDGTWYSRRDAIDIRVITDVKNGTGSIIDSPSEVGGWITPAVGVPCADADADKLPDAFENRYGVTLPNADNDADGYTNIEEYFNGTNPTGSNTPATATNTQPVSTATFTATKTPTVTPSASFTPSSTRTPIPATFTATQTATKTPTATASRTPVPTSTPIPVPTPKCIKILWWYWCR